MAYRKIAFFEWAFLAAFQFMFQAAVIHIFNKEKWAWPQLNMFMYFVFSVMLIIIAGFICIGDGRKYEQYCHYYHCKVAEF